MNITTLLVTILFTGISIYFLVTAANIYKFDTLEIFKLINGLHDSHFHHEVHDSFVVGFFIVYPALV